MITLPRPNLYTTLPPDMAETPEQLREVLMALKGKTFSIDTETTGLEWYREGLIGICLHCPEIELTMYLFTCQYQDLEVPTGRKKKVWTGEIVEQNMGLQPTKVWTGALDGRKRVYETRMEPTVKKVKVYRQEVVHKIERTAVPIVELQAIAQECLMEVASDPKTVMIFHNSRFDCHFLGLDLLGQPCTVLDTSIMVHLYDSRLRKSLDAAERFFLRRSSKRQHVHAIPKGLAKKHRCWPPEVIADYGRNDAVVTYQLAQTLIPKLRKLKLVDLLMCDMEYSKTLWQIERRGMMLNVEFCQQAHAAFIANGKLMEQELFDTIGYEFNWRSNPQLSKALYDDMGFPKPINPFADADGVDRSRFAFKGKYNKFCTSAFLLMEKANHPLGGLILDLREADKLRKATENYQELMDSNGIIHTNFNQTGTRTGRLSSSKPNVQNIASAHRVRETQSAYSGGAIRQEEYNLRQAFMARPGYTFVSIDHSQQEQRLFAILANEPAMLEALRNRLDIHLMIALKVWGDCGPERNKLHREWSKTISFG